ncbi:UDP-glucose 4-epimerase GalE [Corynebacterium sp. CCM 8835]|uniref:UDP-glucose 4-epimerase n=1 Tax=Corynebacterium antarcticum TaxID=2800405 RepID=A0A9Q4CCZ8_9CORY|nr:UDP-glucose 4-epimerase GalE [Corynebacterium antarcticum]MCK7642805.1 UDP-glucose 4-epimerase GalE [Corynebacterium antarcticum]MCK7661309.1 UDP-glucose 4-epimerase GalE [Corynebacterium antarcticum]MCL0246044.1 UDP-glucose 4-epimerase GalE [Corynebacterium antarcticum]MCX7492293.1 UDP-glucose 4-epimerase GalE [Corynebacterium antarcticum]MCX7538590.1 UDP-glucose 4-epimerase GalE [Corynebacterium antarcticum]
MDILITGGAGFIGSTVGSALMELGHNVIVLDNFSTGRREFVTDRTVYEGDIADRSVVDRIFTEHPDIAVTIHCAASIVVPESVAEPIMYYRNNVEGTLELVDALLANGCRRIIFSSSASIYAVREDFAVDEDCDIAPTSPYARTKAHVEGMLRDIAHGTELKVLSLRYFNPIGSDPKMRTGLQLEFPSHAMGKMIEAKNAGKPFTVTGVEWPTRDGSGIRDYIHVWDLAQAHCRAVERFDDVVPGTDAESSYRVINLGTGDGTTVFELADAFSRVSGEKLEVVTGPPRPGDVAGAFTRSSRAKDELGWVAEHSIDEGIADTLKWFEVRGSILEEF